MAKSERIGIWAFYIGLIIALILAIVAPYTGYTGLLLGILAVLGIIVGLLNITGREVTLFLIAALALLFSAGSLASVASFIPAIGDVVATFLQGIVVFIAPAAAIVALKAFYIVARD